MIVLILTFWGISILFSIVAALIYILTNSTWGFTFVPILTSTYYLLCVCVFFNNRHSDRFEVISLWFWFPSLWWLVIWVFFSMSLLAIGISSLGKRLFRFQSGFFLKNNVLMLSCMSFWYVLDINPLLDMSFANIFSHSLGSFFVLVILKESEVAQWCLTLCDPMGCSLPGFSFHGIFQARIPEWVAISLSRKSSWPTDWTWVSCIVSRRFTVWATREVRWYWYFSLLCRRAF